MRFRLTVLKFKGIRQKGHLVSTFRSRQSAKSLERQFSQIRWPFMHWKSWTSLDLKFSLSERDGERGFWKALCKFGQFLAS